MSDRQGSDTGQKHRKQEHQTFVPDTPGYADDEDPRAVVRQSNDQRSGADSFAAAHGDRRTRTNDRGVPRQLGAEYLVARIPPPRPVGDGIPPKRSRRQDSGDQRDISHQRDSRNRGDQQQQQQQQQLLSPTGMARDVVGDSNKQLTKTRAQPRKEQDGYALPSRFPPAQSDVSMDYTLEQLVRELEAAGRFFETYITDHANQLTNADVVGRDDKMLNTIWRQIVSNRFNSDVNESNRFRDICVAIEKHLSLVSQTSASLDSPGWSKPGGSQESAMSKQRRVGLKMLVVLVQGIVMTARTAQTERTSCLAVSRMIKQAIKMLDDEQADNFYLYESKDKGDAMKQGGEAVQIYVEASGDPWPAT